MSPWEWANGARLVKKSGGSGTVKHVKQLSAAAPAPAAAWQDAVCILVTTINGIIEAFGGESPFGGYVVNKCTIPTGTDE